MPIETLLIPVALLLGILYVYRADFAKYSIATFGVFKRLDRTVVEKQGYECAEFYCENETEIAERRDYYKEVVVFGARLLTYNNGTSFYCEDHASFEVRNDLDNPQQSKVVRIAVTVAEVASIFTLDSMDEPEKGELTNASNELQAGISSAFTLLPVIVLVMFMAIIMKSLQPFIGER